MTKSSGTSAPVQSPAQHTPGPWVLIDHKSPNRRVPVDVAAVYCTSSQNRVTIITAESVKLPLSVEENDANARLIAAAPDLLAACKAQHTVRLMGFSAAAAARLGLTDAWERGGVVGLSCAITEMTEAAIAKAEGGAA